MKEIGKQRYECALKDNGLFKNTGIPVGVGIAKTKSLSKLANKFAKKIPKNNNVYVVDSDQKRPYFLRVTNKRKRINA